MTGLGKSFDFKWTRRLQNRFIVIIITFLLLIGPRLTISLSDVRCGNGGWARGT